MWKKQRRKLTVKKDDKVEVVVGDLMEVCRAATAWTHMLRERTPSSPTFEETADSIDQAVERLRNQMFELK